MKSFPSILLFVELFLANIVVIGNSFSTPKFSFIYRFSGEIGKSLALRLREGVYVVTIVCCNYVCSPLDGRGC